MTVFGFSLIGFLVCLLATWQYTLLDPISLLLEWLNISLPSEAVPHLYGLLEGFLEISAQGVMLAVLACGVYLIVRRLRCSKTVCLLLWAVVAVRLLVPVQLPSPLSLFNVDYFSGIQTAATRELDYEFTGDYQYTVPGWENADAALDDGADIVPGGSHDQHEFIYYYEDVVTGSVSAAVSREDGFGGTLALVWAGGAVLLLGCGVVSYMLLKRRLRFAVKEEHLPGVWYSDRISSPCVVGFFRPKIYLTFGLSDVEKEHILAHERQHIQNGDHIWKLLAWLVVCLHWMTIHPLLLLLFYGVFLWNLEEACDQRVLRQLGEEQKADYSQSLLTLSTGKRFRPGPSPIAFGEGDTENRIHSILRYKKPLAVLTALALVVIVVLGVTIATNRVEREDTPAASMDYTITDVVRQSSFSSTSNEDVLSQSLGTTVHLSPDLFSIEGEGFVDDVTVRYPVYRAMDLEDGVLPNFISTDASGQSKEPLFEITLPEGTQGWKVMTNEENDSGYHVFVMDGYIWVGKWVSHGAVGTISEYQYLFRADPSDRVSYEEPNYDDDATPTATLGPVESVPATQGDDLEPLVLTWYIPLDAEDPMAYGFPLRFSFPKDYFDASCAGGTPYAYGNIVLLSGHPIENAKSSYLYWWPYEEGSDEPAKTASITAGVYQDGERVCSCSLLFNLADVTDTDLVYTVRATLHGSEGYAYLQDSGTFGGEIRENDPENLPSPTLAEFSVDLTHDGVDETITILGDYPFQDHWQSYYVLVRDAKGRGLWSDSAGIYHAGQNGIYLYEEDGKHYLMNWCNYGQSGMGSIRYTVFSLTEQGEQVIYLENQFDMEMDDPLSVDLDEFWRVNEKSIRLLSHSMVLVSSNYDTPHGEYYSTPDRILTPILQEDYLLWWTPEELDALQAKAQGTYTFQGEVVSILETAIMVADESLWTEEGYGYCFMIPVDDPAQFAAGGKVQVTADGPLYRRKLPDEGTTVTVEPIM